MKVDDLKPGTSYTYRVGRVGGMGAVWKDWVVGPLYIQTNKKGRVVVISAGGEEFGPENYEGRGEFVGESYLQIKELM